MTTLDLYGNSIGVDGAKAIAEALKVNTVLTKLYLFNNSIGVDGAKAIAEALKVNTVLTILSLGGNSIGDDGAKAIAEAFKVNTVLTTLNLSSNSIGVHGAKAIAEALKVNTVLTTLHLLSNSIGDDLLNDFNKLIDANKNRKPTVANTTQPTSSTTTTNAAHPSSPTTPIEKARSLLKKMLADPMCLLSESESIALLTLCVSDGAENAKKIADKDAVIVIGNTGAGKSTFVNYLLGCDMIEKNPKELGITGLQKVVVVRSKLEGGQCDEVMPIGHDKMSKTFMPHIAADLGNPAQAYCDCPGFLDNRGAEINIANAVNIKRALQEAKCVKVLILINYFSLLADRGRGLREMLEICIKLFGCTANLERFKDALLLGVTQAPKDGDLKALKEWLIEDTPEVMKVLSKRLFLYDPLDRGGSDFWKQEKCAIEIAALKGIPESQSCKMFQTVLTADDEQKLLEIVEKQSNTLQKELDCGAHGKAGSCWQVLQKLRVIDNICVERMLNSIQLRLRNFITEHVALFKGYVVNYQFEKAKEHLHELRHMGSHFDKADLELDLHALESQYTLWQKKQATELDRERCYREDLERYAADTKELLRVNETQKQEMESRLTLHLLEHAQETSNLHNMMKCREADYDKQFAKLQEESTVALLKQKEMQLLNQALSAEEQAKFQEQLQRSYDEKLAATEAEKALFLSKFKPILQQHEGKMQKIGKLKGLFQKVTLPVVFNVLASKFFQMFSG